MTKQSEKNDTILQIKLALFYSHYEAFFHLFVRNKFSMYIQIFGFFVLKKF